MKRAFNFIFTTSKKPDFQVLNGNDFSAETVSLNKDYLTRLRLEKAAYLTKMQELFPQAKFSPKPWHELKEDAYYKNDGQFKEGENYWRNGSLPITQSILKTRELILKSKSDVINKIMEQVSKPNSPWRWNRTADRYALITEYLPPHLSEYESRITTEIDKKYASWKKSTLKPAKERFCIVINGVTGTHKTALARKLIVPKMAETGIVSSKGAGMVVPTPKDSDKLPPTLGKEVMIYDDYGGRTHNWYIFNLFTSSDEDIEEGEGIYGTKGSFDTNAYVKGSIFPSTKVVETWVSDHTDNLVEFGQLLRRTHCTLHIFEKIKLPVWPVRVPITWEHFKNRIFYVGHIKLWVYETYLKYRPDLKYEPLWNFGRTALSLNFAKMMDAVLDALYNDKEYWGNYYDRSQIEHEYWQYQPDTELWTEPNIIRTFKTPSYEWLRQLVINLGFDNENLKLPPLNKEGKPIMEKHNQHLKLDTTNSTTLNNTDPDIVIDVETAPIKFNSLSEYAIHTYQLNQELYQAETTPKEVIAEKIKGKHLIAFNIPFDQTQLYHAGFDIWKNRWTDVALLARIYNNRLAEQRINKLSQIEAEILGTTSKQDYIDQLVGKYGKNYFNHPTIASDPLFHEYALNDTKITKELYDFLASKVDYHLSGPLNQLQTQLAEWQAKGIPFPRDRIERLVKEMEARLENNLTKIVDIRNSSKDIASLRGWSSSILKTKYISKYRREWIPYLKITPTKRLQFKSEDKEKLLAIFPNDEVLQTAYKISYQKQIINNLKELLKCADGEILRPCFKMLGAATGRFTSDKPAMHNFKHHPPKLRLDPTEKADEYSMRTILLKATNVYTIDFKNQEARMMAWWTNEPSMVKEYLENGDLANKIAESLKITRNQAKTVLYGLPYGRGVRSLTTDLGISSSQAQEIYNNFWNTYLEIKKAHNTLSTLSSIETPILRRKIFFSQINPRVGAKMSYTIQGSCVDLLLLTLSHILNSNKVELRGHFHDSVYLACLCKDEHPNCKQSEEFKKELETNLSFFTWKGTNTPVFKFGDVEWTTKGGT